MAKPLRITDPRYIGRYRTVSRLGEGGMGSVYLAEDPNGRLVAVKVIRLEYAHEKEYRARFRSEVNRAREVPPFCTAEVLDADPDHATPYLVVEYIDGPSLNEVVAENGPLTGGNLHGVAVGVVAALAAIHGVGVIHRDLKPNNVLFALGTPKVIDFGIARPLEPTSFHTRTQEMVGTLSYMAPERLNPETDRLLTPAVDVFSWGAVVTYAGTGRTPFGGDSPAVTAVRILTQPPQVGQLPPYLRDLVMAALDKHPENRPTAPELLDRLLHSGTPSSQTLPLELRREAEAAAQHSRRYTTASRRHPGRRIAAITGAAVATALIAGAGTVLFNLNDSTPPAAGPPASASVSQPPEGLVGPAIFDQMLGPGFVDETFLAEDDEDGVDDSEGSCSYQRGLRVIAKSENPALCALARGTIFPPSQIIDIRATLNTTNSCAAIFFRANGDLANTLNSYANAYQFTVCPDSVKLASMIGGREDVIADAKRATTTGTAHRIQLAVDERRVTVAIDGTPVLDGLLNETSLVSGEMLLGAVPLSGRRAEVTFAKAELRSGTDPLVPAVPAFVSGDARLTAAMHSTGDKDKIAVIEPTEYLTGKEYCRRFGLPDDSPKCVKKYVPVFSSTRVSLPIAEDVKYLDYRQDPAKCTDPDTHAGTCRVNFDTYVTSSRNDTDFVPYPGLVTIRSGKVISVANLDLR